MIRLDVIALLLLQEIGIDLTRDLWLAFDILAALFVLAVALILIPKLRPRRHLDSD